MDIKARIEEVINEKGLTKKEVAEKMGKFNQAFNSLLTNPKWETIELVAKALEMSTCEMLFGIKPQEPAPQQPQQPAPADDYDYVPFATATEQQAGQQQGEQQQESVPGVVVCPHCKGRFVAEITFRATE